MADSTKEVLMGYVDFAAIKEAVSIDKAAQLLGLTLTKSGAQFRSPCPICKTGGDRALAITPAKGLFYCFPAQSGGDQIQLVAHVRNIANKDAAEWLGGTVQAPVRDTVQNSTVSKDRAEGFQALDYLEHEHPAVETIGFEPEIAKALGIGYAPKGILRGTVAVPVRLPDGTLAGYIGITEAKLPGRWHLDQTVVPFPKKTA